MSGVLVERGNNGDILLDINIGQPPQPPVFDDWWLPSIDECSYMYTNLKTFNIGGFADEPYWSSTEDSATQVKMVWFENGEIGSGVKAWIAGFKFRAVRRFFTEEEIYSVRDQGEAGGLIFAVEPTEGGYWNYEVTPTDLGQSTWSNITNQLAGADLESIGLGMFNTATIINQVGHTNSPAKVCDDLVSDFGN